MSDFLYLMTLVAAIGCALNGGVLFAFSSFVMAALKRLPPPQGIAAMQSINVFAVTAMFMSAFFGTALLCLGVGGWALFASGDQPTGLLVAGAVTYLLGTIGVTVVGNVPLNDRLAEVATNDDSSLPVWEEYVNRWTTLNHIRVLAALAAAALLTVALAV